MSKDGAVNNYTAAKRKPDIAGRNEV